MDTYLGSDRGVVLGPYAPGEIRPRLAGEQWLRRAGFGSDAVYVIKARHWTEAQTRLDRQLRRERIAAQARKQT